jgi:hypothetical protein
LNNDNNVINEPTEEPLKFTSSDSICCDGDSTKKKKKKKKIINPTGLNYCFIFIYF